MTRQQWKVAALCVTCGLLAGSVATAQAPRSAEPGLAEGLARVFLQVVVHRQGGGDVTLLARNAEGVEQELPVASDQRYEVFLFEPGPWLVRPAPGSGYWGRETLIDPGTAASDIVTSVRDETEVQPEVVPVFEVPAYPAVNVSGRLVGGARPGGTLRVVLGDVDPGNTDPRFHVQRVVVRCPVGGDGRWSCELPATLVHVVFWRPGHSPDYRWNMPLHGRQTLHLGDQKLVPGASLAGFVAPGPDFQGFVDHCAVHVATGDPAMWTTDLESVVATVAVAEDGFFQAAGLDPGTRWIQVDCDGRVAARSGPYELLENAETFPRRRVRLASSHLLDVFVEPGDPPYGSHWIARLRQIREHDSPDFPFRDLRRQYPQQTAAVVGGHARFHVPGDGAFSVEVLDAIGGRFGEVDYVEVVGDRSTVVQLELVPVVGQVTLDGVPLEGYVFFGGRGASPELTFRMEEDGWFRGALPEREDWRVDVASPEHDVAQSFHDVDVPVNEPLTLELTDTVVDGRVVFVGTGAPAAGAMVRFETADERIVHESRAGDDGTFSARGVPAGWIRISAHPKGLGGHLATASVEAVLSSSAPLTVTLRVPELDLEWLRPGASAPVPRSLR
jgi:hypothetical protein